MLPPAWCWNAPSWRKSAKCTVYAVVTPYEWMHGCFSISFFPCWISKAIKHPVIEQPAASNYVPVYRLKVEQAKWAGKGYERRANDNQQASMHSNLPNDSGFCFMKLMLGKPLVQVVLGWNADIHSSAIHHTEGTSISCRCSLNSLTAPTKLHQGSISFLVSSS